MNRSVAMIGILIMTASLSIMAAQPVIEQRQQDIINKAAFGDWSSVYDQQGAKIGEMRSGQYFTDVKTQVVYVVEFINTNSATLDINFYWDDLNKSLPSSSGSLQGGARIAPTHIALRELVRIFSERVAGSWTIILSREDPHSLRFKN
jgi:hypothetical protein